MVEHHPGFIYSSNSFSYDKKNFVSWYFCVAKCYASKYTCIWFNVFVCFQSLSILNWHVHVQTPYYCMLTIPPDGNAHAKIARSQIFSNIVYYVVGPRSLQFHACNDYTACSICRLVVVAVASCIYALLFNLIECYTLHSFSFFSWHALTKYMQRKAIIHRRQTTDDALTHM